MSSPDPRGGPAAGGAPRVSVVIPVMGHPVLVDDAIASAAALLDEGTVSRIIVVNDGCGFAETRDALASWAAALGRDRLKVVPQVNRGLSAARNAGIEVALADPVGPPDALFLLDADNRFAPGAGAAFAALLEGHPEGDWFYPPFDFFGQDGSYAGEAAPSALMHILANHSEAGSLIRTRVFATGLRFAEDLRQGYEDWDFFLAATGRGLVGLPAGRPLMQYRKRPASMLAASHELDSRLRADLRQRHPWLFQPRGLLAREAADFPRYALTAQATGPAVVGSDPALMAAWPAGELQAALFRHLGAPLRHHAPPYVIVMPDALRAALTNAGLLSGILWNIERRFARDPDCEAMTVGIAASDATFGWTEAGDAADAPAITALSPAIIARAAAQGEVPADAAALRAGAARAQLTLPTSIATGPAGDGSATEAQHLLAGLAAHPYRATLAERWDWREPGGARSRAAAITAPRQVAHGGVVLPFLGTPGARLEIGFTVPIFDQGGVEKVVLQLARTLHEAGHACHLFVIGGRPAHLHPDELALFASLSFLPDPSAGDWHGTPYLGTAEPSWGNPTERSDLEGLLRPMDLVINAHAAAVHKVAAALRRGGTRMASHEHLLEVSQYGRSYGPPMLALAYENAYDRILTCSTSLSDWLGAHGVPQAKLMPLVNAPGYPLAPADVAAALAGRADPLAERPLSVLYLGRLDEQKGIDRVAAIFARLAGAGGANFRLTVGGRPVVGGAEPVNWPPGTQVLGAVEGPEALTAAFAGADILILPSRYEGLPLVLLEAQRVGCVPIATDVGAVREAIDHGRTGFVVPEDDCIAAITDHILHLSQDRPRLAAMSEAAAATSRDWQQAAQPLLDWCAAIADMRDEASPEPISVGALAT
ncbi:glycosyltransferase [Paracoccus suum]|uniref:Glycosyltransferase n=1 Tax=Paracoccus suum TaxID=2259340 RepID=A0A344PJN5_9RHOB|nr:glycosyltransferase [Paracoccus suum]AXC49590.1 glycosyltransferase [Paracoccus suum]